MIGEGGKIVNAFFQKKIRKVRSRGFSCQILAEKSASDTVQRANHRRLFTSFLGNILQKPAQIENRIRSVFEAFAVVQERKRTK